MRLERLQGRANSVAGMSLSVGLDITLTVSLIGTHRVDTDGVESLAYVDSQPVECIIRVASQNALPTFPTESIML